MNRVTETGDPRDTKEDKKKGDNFTPRWSWELIFSGSVELMSTTIYCNMKVELSLVAELENDLFFLAELIL